MLQYHDVPNHTTDVLDLTNLTANKFAALVPAFKAARSGYMGEWTEQGQRRQARPTRPSGTIARRPRKKWSLKHPPQKTARLVRVHIMFALLMFPLATAYRRQERSLSAGSAGGANSWSNPGAQLPYG